MNLGLLSTYCISAMLPSILLGKSLPYDQLAYEHGVELLSIIVLEKLGYFVGAAKMGIERRGVLQYYK